MMKSLVLLAIAAVLSGCGPDQGLLMDTKFDAPLRERVMALSAATRSEELTVLGKCSESIGGTIRQELIDAGAEVLSMNGAMFTARISSDDLFSLAALESVTQLQLAQPINPIMP